MKYNQPCPSRENSLFENKEEYILQFLQNIVSS